MVRFKNRYIAIEVLAAERVSKSLALKPMTLSQAIQQKVQQIYGDFGIAAIKAGFSAKYCNGQTKIALVKARHGPHKFLLHCIPSINDIGGHNVEVNILYVGATMKHCFLFLRKYQQTKLEEIWATCRNPLERKKIQKSLMTLTPETKIFA